MPRLKSQFEEGKVIAVNGKAALITATHDDYSRIEYCFIEGDGSLGDPGHFKAWEADKMDIKHIDFAKVRTVVDLPPEWKERAVAYDAEKEEKRAAERKRLDQSEPELHPSYGQVVVSRVSGHTSLFGSPFKHQYYITLSIGRSSRERSLGRDWHFGGMRGGLIEIAMSESQWAHMISSVGQGGGVPCTLQYVGGQPQAECPDQMEVERFHADIDKDMKDAAAFMTDALAKMQALVEDKSPTKEKRKEALSALINVGRKLEDSAPWIAKQLRERMDTIVNEAKTEVEAYVVRTIVDSGIQKLAEVNAKEKGENAKLPFTFPEQNKKPEPKLVEGKAEVKKS